MTSNTKDKTAHWSAFDSERDKQKRLAELDKDQRRDMEIEITDQNGKNIINSDEKEKIARDFLNDAFEKG